MLAGGQSLVRLMNSRQATPAVRDRHQPDRRAGHARPLRRQRAPSASAPPPGSAPASSPGGRTRTSRCWPRRARRSRTRRCARRGTVVGSVAFADPRAELPTALLVLDGQVMARSRAGERTIAADDFFTGPFATALAPDELAVALRDPADDRPDRIARSSRSPAATASCRCAGSAPSSRSTPTARSPHARDRALRGATGARCGPAPRGRRSCGPTARRAAHQAAALAADGATRSATATARPPSAATSPACSPPRALRTAIARATREGDDRCLTRSASASP